MGRLRMPNPPLEPTAGGSWGDELVPVRPVLDFNMVDPRFIQQEDVLSGLDARPSLMELTPYEFESLRTNLFERMGLEARQTQASRDGGVDCVAYDPRPILGGKVVIQAKRYRNTHARTVPLLRHHHSDVS
jgi:restriction system protein